MSRTCLGLCHFGGENMLVSEFARVRQVDNNTITKYISRHSKEFSGHTTRTTHGLELDEIAIELLEKKYLLPKPIEIIEDTESMKKLIAAQEEIIKLKDQINNLTLKLTESKLLEYRIETQNDQIEQLKSELENQPKYKKSIFGFYKKIK